MATKLNTSARNNSTNAIVDELDTGTGNATLPIRTGADPTNAGDASSGTLLATPTFGATAFGNSSAGVATANAIASDTNAAASGDAGYWRAYKGAAADTACEFQGTAGEAADSPELTFDNKTIVAGGTVAITSFTVTTPAS